MASMIIYVRAMHLMMQKRSLASYITLPFCVRGAERGWRTELLAVTPLELSSAGGVWCGLCAVTWASFGRETQAGSREL